MSLKGVKDKKYSHSASLNYLDLLSMPSTSQDIFTQDPY